MVLSKKIFSTIVSFLILILCYNYLWQSIFVENNRAEKINIVNGNCFKYKSSSDIINIVKYLTSKEYGLDEIKRQRKFEIVKDNNRYLRVEGMPNGFLKGYSSKYTNPIAVEFDKDEKRKCLIMLDIYMYKD
ncbi:hypothetical protein [Acinetobacter sp. ANC 4805]|uniref:hypothetical protein n=1 Tax=Acinetobacter sp. ANC 4805 TaxID=2923425 RepID=UPI001F4BAF15|nr:hypothetical protein [Acinetobacter sp. ANC 4805]MCH7311712.1 hypothetical protein [Acinetobacter sp. ANC 4805]